MPYKNAPLCMHAADITSIFYVAPVYIIKKYVILIFQHYCIAQCGHREIRFAGTKLFLSQVNRFPSMLPRKGTQFAVLYTHYRYSQK